MRVLHYLPLVRKELKICEAKNDKYSIDEPPEVELKDLPLHLEYAFLEGDDKLPVIIAKDLSDEEKTALIKFLKLQKRAIACKLSNIKGINPKFCTHKILMEEDFKPAVQHQRIVNPKIYDVIKKEKGGFIVVENEENELILTRLVTGWHRETSTIIFLMVSRVTFKFPSIRKIKKRPHSRVLTEHLPIFACLLGYAMYQACSKGIDFMGLFRSSRGNKYILVAVDYLSKWVEAKALPTNGAQVVCKFLKSLFARFGTPRAIISYRGTYFCNDQFTKVMLKYDVTHRLATAYHPQTSGQVKVSNHGLKIILERTVGENRASWSNKLDDAFGPSVQLSKHPSEKTKRLHDSKIKDRVFNVGDRVLLFNSRLNIFFGKIKTRWSGPFTITHVFPYGTIELSQTDGPNFKMNGHRLKHYFGEDMPKMVVSDLQTLPKDQ
nr:reverse transcriptase domain-containing protein [Tanacetum cinerariifolium]